MTLNATQLSTLAALVPVTTLIVGVVVGDHVKIPIGISESFAYMTTGLLVALVSLDLMPEILREAQSSSQRLGAAFGFVTGGAVLVGLLAAMDSMNTAKDNDSNSPVEAVVQRGRAVVQRVSSASRGQTSLKPILVKESDEEKALAFPIASVVSTFVLLLLDGLLIGIGLESSSESNMKTLAMIMASTIGLDAFLSGVESAVLFEECKRPSWEIFLITGINCGLLLLGGFTGGMFEQLKQTKKGNVAFFYILGTATATALAVISQSQKTTVATETGPRAWYPQIFLYLGFLTMLIIQWQVKGLQANVFKDS